MLDENMDDLRLEPRIRGWYPGRVCSIVELRPQTVIKDEAVPKLLLRAKSPTFVTTNVTDYWRKQRPHARYAFVCMDLDDDSDRVSRLLQRLCRLSEFKTKAARMGKVIRVTARFVQWYAADRRVHSLIWRTA